MSLTVPLRKDMRRFDESDSSTESDGTPSTAVPNSHSQYSILSRQASLDKQQRDPIWRRPACWASSAAFCVTLLLGPLSLQQTSDWLIPALRVLRSWRAGNGVPVGYCEGASSADAVLPPPPGAPEAAFTSWAAGLVAQLTEEERQGLVNGAGYGRFGGFQQAGYYVGNTLAVPRLGIPSIRMQDAAQGFRTTDNRIIGQVTAWPSGLAISAGWDPNATWHWSRAIGQEFRAKGANVILGPAVNVHRVAANGRNVEYISGEDPALGVALAPAYVRGIQEGAGLTAVVKHFVLNQQETSRMTVDEQADERTRWEQYYPPFEAAVRAGVAAVMCSYNLVNGVHSCENSELISADLKGRMSFSGWVMSDWWAMATSKGAAAGTDQDMPGNDGLFSRSQLSKLPRSRLDDMATRIVAGMARTGAWNATPTCRVGCDCDRLLYGVNASSAEHSALARSLAASSAVLLQNKPRHEGGRRTLPLRRGERVAVLGAACAMVPNIKVMAANFIDGDYYVVGGSGRVISPHSVSILAGLQSKGVPTRPSPLDDIDLAVQVLDRGGVDVALICGGATSAESVDRTTLRIDNEPFMLRALQLAEDRRIPTVVVTLAPGAIVAPWRHRANAALTMFLSGQETGGAAADVLLGDVTPSGKLPVTFPEDERDAIWPVGRSPWPFSSVQCPYNEGVKGGWHIYDGKPVAFPFGHGLSYADFEYDVLHDWSLPEGGAERQLAVSVRNVGNVSGAEVAQLYIRYPPEAGEPDLVLRGFQKTPVLAPGESHAVTFSLTSRDLSIWDVQQHSWRLVLGSFQTFVSSSSRDHRLCGAFGGQKAEPTIQC